MIQRYIIWGGTGNYRVVRELLERQGSRIIAMFDNNPELVNPYPEIPFIGGENILTDWIRGNTGIISSLKYLVTIGGGYGKDRLRIHKLLSVNGMQPSVAIHPTAFVASNAVLEEGSMVFANAAVCADARIGRCCIVNTAASVDHECVIGEGSSIGPGARLAGLVRVGKFADIYTGAVILPRIRIGEGAVVGAGAVVLKDVEPYTVVAGNPAEIIKRGERK
jgi:sugar O-acyltransferase (sialic acid O-acetyltransferase NeuD family)